MVPKLKRGTKNTIKSGPGVHGQDSAEIHWVHVLGGSSQDILDYDPIGPFRRVEPVPKRV